jgi:predicted AlkP superfamily pyrophosphatase or phosphodiesterase
MRRLATAALVLGALAAVAWSLPQTPARANHVVIISLDGFPASALDAPYLPLPTLRHLASRGAVAKALRPVDPTVTWPNHTSMVTGVTPARHGVLFNGMLVGEPGLPPRIEPWRDKTEMVRARTLYDAAFEAGLTTAQVDWVAIWNAPTISWEFRERPDVNDRIPREMIGEGLITEADVATFATQNIVWRDEIWTTAAAFILRRHRPNLMLFHLLNLDSTHHRYGPRSPAAVTAMTHLDAQVGRLVKAVDEAGLTDRTTFFVVSDHGFKPVKRQSRPNAALARAGLIRLEGGKITRAEAYSVPEGGTALLYVTVADPSGEILRRAKDALQGLEGIERIVEPAEFHRYGLPLPADNDQMAALFLIAKEGYALTGDTAEPAVVDVPAASLGAHGYVADDPEMQAMFIASGRTVRPATRLGVVSTIDIAPTAARLLGVALPNVQGREITEMLSP